MNQTAEPSLGQIALGLSGGGFRAAAFHLGTLDVLQAVGLLERVAVLSTVSGGTIVGAAYALSAVRGESFARFYSRFYGDLQMRPLATALAQLQDPKASGLPASTLIAAQAEAYDTLYFGGARFAEIQDEQRVSHLQEIAFNATDFASGLPFRFQHSRQGRARIGNGRRSIPRALAGRLRLADIVAASSCFPGGFEPIRYPEDFVGTQGDEVSYRDTSGSASGTPNPRAAMTVPLMDGGVADNQGLDSLLRAVHRVDRQPLPHQHIGLILVSDADRSAGGPLLALKEARKPGWLRVRHVGLIGKLIYVLAVVTLGCCAWQLLDAAAHAYFDWRRHVLPLGLPIATSLAAIIGLPWLRSWFRGQLARYLPDFGLGSEFRRDVIAWVGSLRITQLLDLVEMRAMSLLAMSSSVFMKNIRDLRYRAVYSHHRYRQRAVANLIYELASQKKRSAAHHPSWLQPSPQIRAIAASASRMPTVLWFQDHTELSGVVACGRHTACYNLLDHLLKRYGPQLDGADSTTKTAFARAKQLWLRFQIDPLLDTSVALHNHPATSGSETRS